MNLSITNKSQIDYQILVYLAGHPEAQDTLEGIVEWWLLEQQIKFQTARVQEVLSELVARGLIIEKKGLDSQTHYRLNESRYEEIRVLIN